MKASCKSRIIELRFAILFYSLLAVFLLGPTLIEFGVNRNILVWLIGAIQVCVGLAKANRLTAFMLVGLGCVLTYQSINCVLCDDTFGLTKSPVMMILSFFTATTTFYHAIKAPKVNSQCIYAALVAYLFIGICFGIIFWNVEHTHPNSFSVSGAGVNGDIAVGLAFYFSFVTLTTTGYGDILPLTEIARGIAIAEAIVGQLYLAVMVARLLSAFPR